MFLNLFFAVFPALAAGLSGLLTLRAWQRNGLADARAFVYVNASLFCWTLFATFEYLSPAPEARTLFAIAQIVGVATLPVFWLLFCARYTRRTLWLSPLTTKLLWVVPLSSLLVALSNRWHGLVWQSVTFVADPVPRLLSVYGPWASWVLFPYCYILVFAGLGLLSLSLASDPFAYRRRTGVFFIAAVLPLGLNILQLELRPRLLGFDLTLLGFALGTAMMAYRLFQSSSSQATPISYRTVFLNTAEGVILLTRDNRVSDLNPVAAQLLGLEPKEARGQLLGDIAPLYRPLTTQRAEEVTTTLQTQQVGQPRFLEVKVRTLRESGWRLGKVVILRDITRERAQQAELERFAYLDSLTGLPNRRQLRVETERALGLANRYGWSLSLLYIDLDKFKQINDSYGHEVGDLVLSEVAGRMKRELREGDTVARIGGDEFAALLYNADADAALETCQRLLLALSQPLEVDAQSLQVEASIGVATFPDDGKTMADLLRHADRAMYRAKQGDSGVEFYTPRPDRSTPLP